MRKKEEGNGEGLLWQISLAIALVIILLPIVLGVPVGPDAVAYVSNETKGTVSPILFNVSGGYISTFNLTASSQNVRWKAFIGNITGEYSLDDASGSTIYDWTLASVSGEVYASRNNSISWTTVRCANSTDVLAEQSFLAHTGTDNITATFNTNNSDTFIVAGTSITSQSCNYSTHTYVNSAAQTNDFEETIIYAGATAQPGTGSIIYVSVLEADQPGYDGGLYDFQMIVPENGSQLWTSSIAYYVYVEVS